MNQVHLGLAPSWGQVIFALLISMVAYTGIETVSNMAEEARDPDHDVPRTVNYVLLAVLGIFAGISIISLMALPVTKDAAGHFSTALGTTYKQDPVLGIVSALPLGHIVHTAFRYYVGVLAATILVIATNAGLRDLAAVLVAGRAPPTAARLRPGSLALPHAVVHDRRLLQPRDRAPDPGEDRFLGNLYSFGAMLSFTTAHVSIVALRFKDPDRHRPYRVPWNVRFRGGQLPLAAVVGALGTFAAWLSVVVLHGEARTVGVGWMVVGVAGYFVYRRRSGLDPRARYRIPRRAAPAGFRELAYGSALVPMFGRDVSGQALRRAARLAGEGATVDAVYVSEVPHQLSWTPAWSEKRSSAGGCSRAPGCGAGRTSSRSAPAWYGPAIRAPHSSTRSASEGRRSSTWTRSTRRRRRARSARREIPAREATVPDRHRDRWGRRGSTPRAGRGTGRRRPQPVGALAGR